MTRPAQLRRLHFLNALFAPLTGSDLYLAGQIDAAITSSLAAAGEATAPDPEPTDPAFVRAAADLFGRLGTRGPQHGFFHWDAGADRTAADPLFARAGLMDGLRRLARFDASTVLVTNLRAAHCPPRGRWTARRARAYDDTLALLRQLAATRSRPGAQMNLVFL